MALIEKTLIRLYKLSSGKKADIFYLVTIRTIFYVPTKPGVGNRQVLNPNRAKCMFRPEIPRSSLPVFGNRLADNKRTAKDFMIFVAVIPSKLPHMILQASSTPRSLTSRY